MQMLFLKKRPLLVALIVGIGSLTLIAASIFVWPDWPSSELAAIEGLMTPDHWQTIEIAANGQIIKTVHEPYALVRNLSIVALSFIGVGLCGLRILTGGASRAEPNDQQKLSKNIAKAGLKLDGELGDILELVKSHLLVNKGFSESLDRAHRDLPISAKPEQVRMTVKFLIAENEKMQRDSQDLRRSLEQSRAQIQELRSNLAVAQEMGMRDSLTELRSRRYFDLSISKEIEEAHERGTPLCLVMADIDHFKRINDTFGHLIGDEILKNFSSLVLSNVKGRDIVARYGGEEFALILPHTDLEGATRLTEQIRSQLAGKKWTVKRDGQPVGKLTASFGVAELCRGEDAERLVRRADASLYEAKNAGRNCVVAAQAA
jgi:diguanylate cyclase